MKYTHTKKWIGRLIAAVFTLGMSQAALAVGTASGTIIGNTATVNFEVGGVPQTAATGSINFTVDNKVDTTVVTTDATYVGVSPGATAQVLTFTVTNTGNTIQDFSLAAAANATDPFGGVDNFDATGVVAYAEDGTTAGYQAAEDVATYIDELAADTSTTVYIVASIPLAQVDGDIAAYTLTADAGAGGTGGAEGAAVTATVGPDTAGIDIVLADAAGDTDAANAGDHSDSSAFIVASASLTVAKSSLVIDDPVNGVTDPKAIPGATVTYTITVSNTGGTNATSVVLVDSIPANTTYVATTITLGGAGKTDGLDGDEADYDISTVGAVTVNVGTVAAAGSATVTFDVTID